MTFRDVAKRLIEILKIYEPSNKDELMTKLDRLEDAAVTTQRMVSKTFDVKDGDRIKIKRNGKGGDDSSYEWVWLDGVLTKASEVGKLPKA